MVTSSALPDLKPAFQEAEEPHQLVSKLSSRRLLRGVAVDMGLCCDLEGLVRLYIPSSLEGRNHHPEDQLPCLTEFPNELIDFWGLWL